MIKCKIKYLPIARKDLTDIINYISDTLKAPEAAMELLEDLDHSIANLAQYPYAYKVYHPIEPLESEYRILPVKKYLVFYVINKQDVEIHRIVYARMDLIKSIR